MLVLLPPSETKTDGGDGPPLQLDALAFPELDAVRKALLDELVEVAGDVEASRAALGLSARQDAEIARNAMLWSSPTMPTLLRYTGVLYDALDVRSLRGAAAERARARLAVGSALFGLLRADDPVPAYRLSAGSTLPTPGTLAARWKPALEPVLADIAANELVVDLRSGSYAARHDAPHSRLRAGSTGCAPHPVRAPPTATRTLQRARHSRARAARGSRPATRPPGRPAARPLSFRRCRPGSPSPWPGPSSAARG